MNFILGKKGLHSISKFPGKTGEQDLEFRFCCALKTQPRIFHFLLATGKKKTILFNAIITLI